MKFGNLGKIIGDAILQPEETQTPAVVQQPVEPVATPPATRSTLGVLNAVPTAVPAASAVDKTLVTQIEDAVNAETGPAYRKFLEMMTALVVVPEGPMRIKAAFAAAKVSQQDILNELQRRMTVLDGELKTVETSAAAAREQSVGGLQQQAASLDQLIAGKEQQIRQIEEQIQLLREGIAEQQHQKAEFLGRIPGEEAKIDIGLSRFRSAHAHVKATMQAEMATIAGIIG